MAPPSASSKPPASTKLAPPQVGRRLVPRERLVSQIVDARRRRCLVLQGPAGCGKTTTVVAALQSLLPLGFNAGWLTVGPEDSDPAILLDQLLASLAGVDPDITREALELAGHGTDAAATERTVVALVRGIVRHAGEVVLVLDELQHLADLGVHAALQWLLDYSPPNLHCVLISRNSIPVSLARLRSQQQVLELDLRDLRFSAAESEQFLRAQLGKIEARDAQHLHELSDGWVAGLQLYAIDLKKRRQRGAARLLVSRADVHAYVQDAQTFSAYFEREVLSQLAPNELELLISASACKRFCAPLCAALAGRPDATAEVVVILERLESDNLFVVPEEEEAPRVWYRLHPLLRETLRERLGRRSDARRHQLHQAAWNWLREYKLFEEAIYQAIAAGEEVAAAQMLEQEAFRFTVRGELRKLAALVRRLPEALQTRPMLRIWMVRVDLYTHNFEACMAGIRRLREDLPIEDVVNRYKVTMVEANLAVQRDNLDAAMQLLPQLLQAPEGTDVMTLGSRDNILSWLYMHRGEHDRAIEIQQGNPHRVIDGVPLLGTGSGTLQGRCLVGLSHAMKGDMTQAERIYRDVIHEALEHGGACSTPANLATALLAEVLYEINEPEAVLRLVGDRIDVLERMSIPDSVMRLFYALSASHWVAGRVLESFACLDRLEDYATELGLDRLLVYSLTFQLQRRLALGQMETATELLRRIDDTVKRLEASGRKFSDEIPVISERARIRWLMTTGDLDAAIDRIDRLMEWMSSRKRRRLFAHLLTMRAVIQMRRGYTDKARQCMIEALRQGHSLGLVRGLLDADPAAAQLIREAAADPSIDPVLAFYAERLCPPGDPQFDPGAAVPAGALAGTTAKPQAPLPIETLSERELEVVRLLAQALPNKKIARVMGVSPETVKWHLKNVFTKLGVSGRDDAVARFREQMRDDDAPR